MRLLPTEYGTLQIGSLEETFRAVVEILRTATTAKSSPVSVGLSGGSTPKAFYQWAIRENAIPENIWEKCLWLTSDERCVPLTSDESNFGNADRLFLTPLGVPESAKLPWPVELTPGNCAAAFNTMWNARFGAQRGFDVCFLGMGDDGHTASLFPGCPLIGSGLPDNFGEVKWPERGWRLTITQKGLSRCARVVVITNGANKAGVLREIVRGPYDPQKLPSQIHKNYAARVTWLVDEAAASQL